MSRAKIDVVDTGNIGIYADFGSKSEDDEWERKQIEKEDEDIRDFVKCHPMPSPDDEEGEQFWKKVIDRMKEAERANGIIFSFVRIEIMKKMYENLTIKRSSLIVVRNLTEMVNSTL